MGQILLVRHGQASFGAANYDQLSGLGAQQAAMLGRWLTDCGQRFSAVVMGGLARHRQTAEACLAELPTEYKPSTPPLVEARFNEYDHEEILRQYLAQDADARAAMRTGQGENPRKVFQRVFMAAMARWISGEHDGEYRESWSAFRQRCNAAVQALVEQAGASQNIVVFTSGGPISVICQQLLGVADRDAALLNTGLVNSAVTKLLYQPGRVSLSYLNNFAHLERAADPALITYR